MDRLSIGLCMVGLLTGHSVKKDGAAASVPGSAHASTAHEAHRTAVTETAGVSSTTDTTRDRLDRHAP